MLLLSGNKHQTPNATSNGGDASRVGIFQQPRPAFPYVILCFTGHLFSQQLYWKEINIICLHSALSVCTALIISVFWRVYKRAKCLHSSALICTCLHSSARNGYLALRGEALFSVMGGEVYGNGRQKNQILRQEIRSPCTQFCE